MNSSKNLILGSLICGLVISATLQCDVADKMKHKVKKMHEEMDKLAHSFDEFFETTEHEFFKGENKLSTDITINQPEEGIVEIICKGITGENIEAPIKENNLTIKTPNTQINVLSLRNRLWLKAVQEEKQDNKDEENIGHSFKRTEFATTHPLEQPLDLEKTTIDYNKEEETLTVRIPTDNAAEKTIPINILK